MFMSPMEITLLIILGILIFLILAFLLIGKIMYNIIFKRRKNDENFASEESQEDKNRPCRIWLRKQKIEELTIESKDHLKLKGYYINNNSNKIAIFVHGYRGRYYSSAFQAEIFFKEGYDIFFANNRAHDTSEGKYFSMGEKEKDDLLLWINTLLKKNAHYQIVLMGVSMGAHIASITASTINKNNLKCLILDCGYASLKETLIDQCNITMNYKLSKFLIWILSIYTRLFHHFSLNSCSKESLSQLDVAVLFIHGDKDETVKIKNMFDNISYLKKDTPYQKAIFLNRGHNEANKDEENYTQSILSFIRKYN